MEISEDSGYLHMKYVHRKRLFKKTNPVMLNLLLEKSKDMATVDDYHDKLSFLAEWFDYEALLHKNFILNYYISDNTLDLFDRDLARMFLKRTKCDELDYNDMYTGNTVRIYGRQIKITGYADCRTQKSVGKSTERVLCLMKPRVVHELGDVITYIQKRGFRVSRLRMCLLTRKEALEFYAHRKGEVDLPFILEQTANGPAVAMELVGENAILRLKEIMGPGDPIKARKVAPNSLRALYGIDSHATSGFHGSGTSEETIKEINFLFPNGNKPVPQSTLKKINTTCCVIKPHAIHAGNLGYIISSIQDSHFRITAAQIFYLNNANVDEFLDIYKGIISDFHALKLSFLDGPCLVLEVGGKQSKINVHQEFRQFCGPTDSEVARQIRPNTLRAIYGCSQYRNAVHCTDLPEDTVLELEYFFEVLRE